MHCKKTIAAKESKVENLITNSNNTREQRGCWPSATMQFLEKFYGPHFESSCGNGGALWGLGASGWVGRRPGVGLAEFKRVVRVAVNFLLQDGSG